MQGYFRDFKCWSDIFNLYALQFANVKAFHKRRNDFSSHHSSYKLQTNLSIQGHWLEAILCLDLYAYANLQWHSMDGALLDKTLTHFKEELKMC